MPTFIPQRNAEVHHMTADFPPHPWSYRVAERIGHLTKPQLPPSTLGTSVNISVKKMDDIIFCSMGSSPVYCSTYSDAKNE